MKAADDNKALSCSILFCRGATILFCHQLHSSTTLRSCPLRTQSNSTALLSTHFIPDRLDFSRTNRIFYFLTWIFIVRQPSYLCVLAPSCDDRAHYTHKPALLWRFPGAQQPQRLHFPSGQSEASTQAD